MTGSGVGFESGPDLNGSLAPSDPQNGRVERIVESVAAPFLLLGVGFCPVASPSASHRGHRSGLVLGPLRWSGGTAGTCWAFLFLKQPCGGRDVAAILQVRAPRLPQGRLSIGRSRLLDRGCLPAQGSSATRMPFCSYEDTKLFPASGSSCL